MYYNSNSILKKFQRSFLYIKTLYSVNRCVCFELAILSSNKNLRLVDQTAQAIILTLKIQNEVTKRLNVALSTKNTCK